MTAPKLTPDTPATRRAFNRLAREKMKLRLLADIRMDLMVCELEGWDKLEYLDELLALVQEKNISALPIVEDSGKLCGLITRSSLMTTLSHQYLDNQEEGL